MGFFPSQEPPNEYNAVQGQIYKFQGSELQAEHPPIGDISNKVVTTGWLHSYLTSTPMMPTVSDASTPPGTGLIINVSDGQVNKPNGSSCQVNSTIAPISVVANSVEYVYIRYSDCSIVVSTVTPPADEGAVIAEVGTNTDSIIYIKNFATHNSWATVYSPFFQGDPQAPHPPSDDNDNSIATTKWVRDRLLDFLTNQPMQGLPTVVDAGGLKINVTTGKIDKPMGGECDIQPLNTPISVRALADGNTYPKEQVWVRYSDCTIIVTSTIPNTDEGFRLAEITTNDDSIVSIEPLGGTINSLLSGLFGTAFGGDIIFIGGNP